MRRILQVAAVSVLGAAAAACGSSAEPTATGSTIVQGTVSSRLSIDNGRAVAIGSDGRTFWTYLDAHRDFTLRLPVGQSYRIVIANQIAGEVAQHTVGHVVLPASGGGTTRWLGANEPIVVNLGTLRPVKSGGIKTACNACGGDDEDEESKEANHDDDHACHDKSASKPKPSDNGGSCGSCEDDDDDDDDKGDKGDKGDKSGKGYDDDEECNVCKDDADVELEPSKKPGKECEDKDAEKGEKKKSDYDDEKPCTKKSGGSGGDKSAPDDKGGDGYGGGDKNASDDKGSSSGGKSGSKCKVTNECSSECSCVASKCAPK